jgi:RNA polymerase sigma factor for flagellar operon FliA
MARQFRRKRAEASVSLERHLDRRPSEAELAQALQMPVSKYRRLDREALAGSLISLDTLIAQRGDWLAGTEDPVATGERTERLHRFADAIELLSVRERYVLRALLMAATAREIASQLGVNESRVSQIKSAAIAKLRVVLGVSSSNSVVPHHR